MAEDKVKPKAKPKAEIEEKKVPKAKIEPVAKAGKRSTKALQEAEIKEEKEARKKEAVPTKVEFKAKPTAKPTRSKTERKGKKYRELIKEIDKSKAYQLSEAIALAVKTSPTKFDATVELHFRLGVDPRQADQNIRDNIVLPSGSGKTVRIAVFAEEKDLAAAKKAGADIALGDEFLQQLDKNVLNFDVLVASPAVMAKLSKYAKLLGPKGLMPNPKNGTVTANPAKSVEDSKGGKVEYKIDSSGIVHLGIGKVSFGVDKLMVNADVVVNSIKANKPSSLKGNYVNSVYVATSMGPSIQVDRAL